jgi:sugar O-acyltransferase (sialic acid O-acetyltransferase NeuD family)
MKDIVIIGSGGFAKEVAFLIDSINKINHEWNILGYIAKEESDIGKQHGKYKICNSDSWLINSHDNLHVAFGLADPEIISLIVNKLKSKGNLSFPNLIHPNVIGDWEQIKIGSGNIICAGNIFTIDIEIGSFNIFNLSCTIGHDSIVGSYNVLNPSVNLSGEVKLGNKNLVGTGTQIIQSLIICDNNKISAGSLIFRDIIIPGTYVGVPARKIS